MAKDTTDFDLSTAWDRVLAWAGWEHAEAIELLDAAYLLTATKPRRHTYNRVLSSDTDAMLQTLKQSALIGNLPIFAAWAWDENGHPEPIGGHTMNPHIPLHAMTTVKVTDLAAWCDARNIPHPWQSSESVQVRTPAIKTYPAELRAAIEAFKAVHGNLTALRGKSPKQALLAWLEKNADLGANARKRVATVANWQPQGGAAKTPSE
ncbi:hypothetical protein [Oleiagrimonas sp.]|jgi:hypothetical protein|uniref:hypothetical protein n=1 Tax=Oleiagrimonas sp. TaxID=2010330 RepID=UPI002626E503|nr:hypothetical protein [Oleiagrimonas sp.]MDA3913116.1 hypothetical protein [Oleiagrimonas sp.]